MKNSKKSSQPKLNKNQKRMLIALLIVVIAVVIFIISVTVAQRIAGKTSRKISLEEAQKIITEQLISLPEPVSSGAKFIVENSSVTVNSIEYGQEKDVILNCTYKTYDINSVISQNIDKYVLAAYNENMVRERENKKTNATVIRQCVQEELISDISNAEFVMSSITLYIYEVGDNVFKLYLSDEVINTIFGGILSAHSAIDAAQTVTVDGKVISIATKNTLRTGIKDCLKLKNYDSTKPDTAIGIIKAWNAFKLDFHRNFIEGDHWKYLFNGLITTLQITALAVLLGILIGFIVAVIRCTNQKTGSLSFLASVCRLYLSVMRGTPVMVQLLIVYFVVLLPIGVEKFPAAVICFGLNSGAYVSEIVRGGIMSIDEGQTEAGRSLGFNYMQTMLYIIIPQAFKAVLPSLANEFITLLKESSVAFYIGVADLTQGGLKIRSITYSNYMPLIAVAVIYLILVLGLSKCVSILERRLRKGDNR